MWYGIKFFSNCLIASSPPQKQGWEGNRETQLGTGGLVGCLLAFIHDVKLARNFLFPISPPERTGLTKKFIRVFFHSMLQKNLNKLFDQANRQCLEKEMATHSSIITWRIPWTEEPAGYIPWSCKNKTRLSNQTTHHQQTMLSY